MKVMIVVVVVPPLTESLVEAPRFVVTSVAVMIVQSVVLVATANDLV